MLNDPEFQDYCRRLRLCDTAVTYIERVRKSSPSRRVHCGRDNVTAHYPSRKMGRMVAVESHSVELPFAYRCERDPDVLEYWPQPAPVKLSYEIPSGRSIGVIHTPDFLIMGRHEAGWVECKAQDRLLALCIGSPRRYQQTETGRWRSPPGEEVAVQFGFFYRLWSDAELDVKALRNLRFLEDYLVPDHPAVPENSRETIIDAVRRTPGLSLSHLAMKIGVESLEHVYALIARNEIYVDLGGAVFSKPDLVKVFPNEMTAVAFRFAQIQARPMPQPAVTEVDASWRALRSVTVQEEPANPRSTQAAEELFRSASQDDLKMANHRYQVLTASAQSEIFPDRTLRRWRRRFREAERDCGCGYVGLLPRYSHRGNRTTRFPEELYALSDQVIATEYHSPKGKSKFAAYGVFAVECRNHALPAPSYEWFAKRVRQHQNSPDTSPRLSPMPSLRSEKRLCEVGISVHGEFPWDLCHVDNHLCDIELVCSETDMPLGRPWLSLLLDGFSRRVLSFVLGFDKPSYRSTMIVMREAVRRHGRLPATLVVDEGVEFRNTAFDTLCNRYGCTIKFRSSARPQFGSIIERMFGSLGTQFFQNLAGSTRAPRDWNMGTMSAQARKEAVWTLEAVHGLLEQFFDDIYDDRVHPALNTTPHLAYEKGVELAGKRHSREIAYDESFVMMTLPTTSKGTALVQDCGVKINYIYYWCDEFRGSHWRGASVPVRFDPWNLAVAWVHLKGTWHRCVSSYAESFEGRTERELMLASTKIRQVKRQVGRNRTVTAMELAEFFQSAEAEEKLRKQRLKDRASKRTRSASKNEPEWADFVI